MQIINRLLPKFFSWHFSFCIERVSLSHMWNCGYTFPLHSPFFFASPEKHRLESFWKRMEISAAHSGRHTWQSNSPVDGIHGMTFFFLSSWPFKVYINCYVDQLLTKYLRKLTIGILYKPKTEEMAIERVDEESPTIPTTGGFPSHLSSNKNCSSEPLTNDKAARNPIASCRQLSYRLYPSVTFGSRLGFLLTSLIANTIVWACLNPRTSKLSR